jgi:hypothetical protein
MRVSLANKRLRLLRSEAVAVLLSLYVLQRVFIAVTYFDLQFGPILVRVVARIRCFLLHLVVT